jgi:hypothetical protein
MLTAIIWLGSPFGLGGQIMRAAILILSMLLLTGCYESQGQLLDAGQARQPITGYQDWNYGSGDHRYHAHLNPRADGWYDYEEAKIGDNGSDGEWKHHTVLLNYMTAANGYDIYAFSTWDDAENAYFYGVVVVGANGFWQSITPNCDPIGGEEAWVARDTADAKAAGAEVKDADSTSCVFTSRGQLFQALNNVVNESGFWTRVNDATK